MYCAQYSFSMLEICNSKTTAIKFWLKQNYEGFFVARKTVNGHKSHIIQMFVFSKMY